MLLELPPPVLQDLLQFLQALPQQLLPLVILLILSAVLVLTGNQLHLCVFPFLPLHLPLPPQHHLHPLQLHLLNVLQDGFGMESDALLMEVLEIVLLVAIGMVTLVSLPVVD